MCSTLHWIKYKLFNKKNYQYLLNSQCQYNGSKPLVRAYLCDIKSISEMKRKWNHKAPNFITSIQLQASVPSSIKIDVALFTQWSIPFQTKSWFFLCQRMRGYHRNKRETKENESRSLIFSASQFKGFSRAILTKCNLLTDFTSIHQTT